MTHCFPMTTTPTTAQHTLSALLKSLKLSHMLRQSSELEQQALQQNWTHSQFLLALCEHEHTQRSHARIQRALHEAHFPPAKTLSNYSISLAVHPSMLLLFIQLAQDYPSGSTAAIIFYFFGSLRRRQNSPRRCHWTFSR